jgi:hypothetical protein
MGRNVILAARWGCFAAIALTLSACVSTSFRDAVGQFGTLTKAAATAQNARLDALAADETERIHNDLAVRRVDLRFSADCVDLINLPQRLEDVEPNVPPCRLIEQRGDPNAPVKPVETVSYNHIRALSAALADYSNNLILLAADSTTDRKTFATSVSGLATSLGGLDGALRKATSAEPATSTKTLDGIGALIGKAGGLVLAAERARVLKQIVQQADPLVQEAVAILADVDNRLGVYDMANRARALSAARIEASNLAHDPSASSAQIRAAQDELFAKFTAYSAGAAEQRHYAAIGAAHHKLALAARAGASPAELQEAIEAVLDLASATSDLISKPKPTDAGGK